jgi:DNA repair exonuclease SbcCD ATPase subunit
MPEMTSNMPQPESDHGDGSAAPDGNQATSETRIDRPHVMPTTAEPGSIPAEIVDEALAEISDLDDSAAAGVELHHQADELAAYLRARLKELDHRESLLNARSAQLDAALRGAQAMINERQVELAGREQELADRERDFESHPEARTPAVTESQPSSIERREAALVATRKESGRVYAHAFDMCAAAEELWKEMSRGADRAALAKALHKVRTLSDEHHRTQDEELAEKKRRLENVRRQLSEENRRLQEHEKELRQWVQQRELALECRTAQLAAKEARSRRQQAATDKLV